MQRPCGGREQVMLQKQTTAEGQHEGGGMMWVEKLQRLGNTGPLGPAKNPAL